MPYPIFEYKENDEDKTLDISKNPNEVIGIIANIDNTYTGKWVSETLEKQPQWKQAYDALTSLMAASMGNAVAAGEAYSKQLKEIEINKENQNLVRGVIIVSIGLAVRQLMKANSAWAGKTLRMQAFNQGLESALSLAKNPIFNDDPTIQAILKGTANFCTAQKENSTVKAEITKLQSALSPSSSTAIAKNLNIDVKTVKSSGLDLDSPVMPATPSLSSSSSSTFSQVPLTPTTPAPGQMPGGLPFIESSIKELEIERDTLLKEIGKLQAKYVEKPATELKHELSDKNSEYKEIVDYLRDQRHIAKGLQIEHEFMMTEVKPALDALKKHLDPGKSSYIFSLIQSIVFSSNDSKNILSHIDKFGNSQEESAVELLPKLISQLEEASQKDSRIARLPADASIEKFQSLLGTLKEKIAPYTQEKTTEEQTENVQLSKSGPR